MSSDQTTRVPPPFRERYATQHPFNRVEWMMRDKGKELRDMEMVIPSGMPVHPDLIPWYWQEVAHLEEMFESGWRPQAYLVLEVIQQNPDKSKPLATGVFDGDDTPNDIAWIVAMQIEQAIVAQVKILYLRDEPESSQPMVDAPGVSEGTIASPPVKEPVP